MQIKKVCALVYYVGKCARMNKAFDVSEWDDDTIEEASTEMNYITSEDKNKSSEPTELTTVATTQSFV